MRNARPYAEKVRNIAAHMGEANPEYLHPFMAPREGLRGVGYILVTTDKGLAGGLNTNVLRVTLAKMRELEGKGGKSRVTAIGNKGLSFMSRMGGNIVSQVTQMGDTPHIEKLIGAVKVQLDAYTAGETDAVYLCYTQFINTMRQEPQVMQLLPLGAEHFEQTEAEKKAYGWDYIYEPDAKGVIDELMIRYVEALVYQAVAENMASEQSARMVAMKAASDNAKNVISELQLTYNKARQAAITKELSEIVGGAAAIGA
jgi:F-type H+-transporting ATPase subunit gamma